MPFQLLNCVIYLFLSITPVFFFIQKAHCKSVPLHTIIYHFEKFMFSDILSILHSLLSQLILKLEYLIFFKLFNCEKNIEFSTASCFFVEVVPLLVINFVANNFSFSPTQTSLSDFNAI